MMKQNILPTLLLAITLLAVATVQAQNFIGIKGGVTSAQLFIDNINARLINPEIEQNTNSGITFGLAYRSRVAKHVGIQVEANYVQKGWVENTDQGNAIATDLNYVEFPVLTHLSIGRGKTNVILEGGPYVGFLMSFSTDPLAEAEATYFLTDQNDVNTAYGMAVGGGITRKIGNHELHLGGRFYIALSNVFDQVNDDIPDYTQSQTIEFSMAFFYGISKRNRNTPIKKTPKAKKRTDAG